MMQTEAEEKLRDLEKQLRLQLHHKEQELELKEEEARQAKSQLLTAQRDQAGSTEVHALNEKLSAQVDIPQAPSAQFSGTKAFNACYFVLYLSQRISHSTKEQGSIDSS